MTHPVFFLVLRRNLSRFSCTNFHFSIRIKSLTIPENLFKPAAASSDFLLSGSISVSHGSFFVRWFAVVGELLVPVCLAATLRPALGFFVFLLPFLFFVPFKRFAHRGIRGWSAVPGIELAFVLEQIVFCFWLVEVE